MKTREITLALIKPHAVRNSPVFQAIRRVIEEHFHILLEREVSITTDLAEHFYSEHKERFFYNRLITSIGSGPCYALILAGEDVIQRWRLLMGPTKVFRAIYTHPECLRALYGLSDTRNACHGSDGSESARREISILFPGIDLQTLLENHQNTIK